MRPVLAVAAILVAGILALWLAAQAKQRAADDRARADRAAAREEGPDPAAEPDPDRLEISGRVLGARGATVTDATVRLKRQGREIGRTRSGADGAYRLRFPAAGTYDLEAYAPRVGWARRNLLLERPVAGLDLALQTAPPFDGIVLDRSGAPVASAHIAVRDRPWARDLASTRTGTDGRFVLDAPADQGHVLVVSAPGFVATLLGLSLREREGVVIVLDRGFLLRVLVVDPAGGPVAGAEVRALCGLSFARGTTGRDGVAGIRLGRLGPAGPMSVAAVATGFAAAVRGRWRPASSATEADAVIVVDRGGTVRGEVKEEGSGTPLAGVEVRAVVSEHWRLLPDPVSASTDAKGAYELTRVPLEADDISVDHPGFVHEQEWRVIGSKMVRAQTHLFPLGVREAYRDFALLRRTVIRGQVVDRAGQPIRGAVVTSAHSVVTDAKGRYAVARSSGVVFAHHPAHGDATVEIEPGVEEAPLIVLGPRAGIRIEGRVVRPDGAPAPGVDVTLSKEEDFHIDPPSLGAGYARTGRDGIYRMSVAEPGSYVLECAPSGYARSMREIEVEESGRAPDLVLERGPTIRGRVVDVEGRPLIGVLVSADVENEFRFYSVLTGREGRFRLHDSPEAGLGVKFDYPGLHAEERTLKPGPGEARIVMRPRAVLRGVVTAAGEPVADAWVTAYPGGACRTNERGEFVLADLRPKRLVDVTVDHPLYTFFSVSKRSLDEGPLKVTLEPGRRFRGLVRDEDGSPVARATVEIGGRKIETGTDGRFHVGGLKPGALTALIGATRQGFAWQPPVEIPAHANDWEFTVQKGAPVTGRAGGDEIPSFLEIKAGEHDVMVHYDHRTGAFRTVPLPFHGIALTFLLDGNEREVFVRGGTKDLDVRLP